MSQRPDRYQWLYGPSGVHVKIIVFLIFPLMTYTKGLSANHLSKFSGDTELSGLVDTFEQWDAIQGDLGDLKTWVHSSLM